MQHQVPVDHARHDLGLVAGHAAGDLADTQAVAAATLLSECAACAELHRDLVAISAATRALPPVRAPRDYRLTAEQAAGLRRGSRLRALLRPFASARSATRPLAATFTSVGVAGLLVAAFIPGMLGSAAGPSVERADTPVAGAPLPSDGDALGPLVGQPAPNSSQAPKSDTGATAVPEFNAQAGPGGAGSQDHDGSGGLEQRLAADTPLTSLVLFGSLGFLLVGLSLFGLRLAARRVR